MPTDKEPRPTGKEWRLTMKAEAGDLVGKIRSEHRRVEKYTKKGQISCTKAKRAYRRMREYRFSLRTLQRLAKEADDFKLFQFIQKKSTKAVAFLDDAYIMLEDAGCK